MGHIFCNNFNERHYQVDLPSKPRKYLQHEGFGVIQTYDGALLVAV
ncbi:MAG: hypothetical protein HRT88_19340 [Lentisphaeraceae bacterium]|nr:hypothetical protein [Lentisphaeraceae bacterium]